MMSEMKKWLVFFFTLIVVPAVSAQDCNDKLIRAQDLYNMGQFSEVIEMANSCLQVSSGVSDQDEINWKAYRLLALAHLAQNENTAARDAAVNMLALNPRYSPSNLKDPEELIKLLNSITIIPKFSLGLAVSLGLNNTFPSISKGYTLTETTKQYEGLSSYQFGLSTAFQFNETMSAGLSLLATSKRFEITYPAGDWEMRTTEQLTYVNVPVTFAYIPKLKTRIRPYVQAGVHLGVLFLTDNSFYAKYKGSESYSLEHIQSMDRRNKLDYGYNTGIGAFYRIGDGQLYIQANYFGSLHDVTNPDNRYKYDDLRYRYYYIDDDFKLNNLYIGLGYSIHVNYKVIK